jgi:hypothetical protein
MAMDVDEMDSKETLSPCEIAGAHQVQRLRLRGALGDQRRLWGAPRLIGVLAGQIMAVQDAVNGPDLGQRLHTPLVELPWDGEGAPVGGAGLDHPLPPLTDQALYRWWGLHCPGGEARGNASPPRRDVQDARA